MVFVWSNYESLDYRFNLCGETAINLICRLSTVKRVHGPFIGDYFLPLCSSGGSSLYLFRKRLENLNQVPHNS